MNKHVFYPKMAAANMYKNKKMYIPYISMCIFLVAMYYMMSVMLHNSDIQKMNEVVILLLHVGIWVLRIFSVIFLFYLNSFLMKRRQKEFGLYNILGMEKRHIGKMMLFETFYVTCGSILAGMLAGMLFARLLFLLLFRLIGANTLPKFDLSVVTVAETAVFFTVIFLIAFLYNLTRVHMTNAIALLHADQMGEKEPKTKIVMAILGVLSIGFGYGFALYAKSPVEAMELFIIAVLLVVIGTYTLFTAGSIALLKMLRKNKKFYYRTGPFMSVSGMLYRMKQNAVGLASICILSTMVLISVSTTVCLYMGMEDTANSRSPMEISIGAGLMDYTDSEQLLQFIRETAKEEQVSLKESMGVHTLLLMASSEDGRNYQVESVQNSALTVSGIHALMLIPLQEFNEIEKTHYTLEQEEVLLYTTQDNAKKQDRISIVGENVAYDYTVKQYISHMHKGYGVESFSSVVPITVAVVRDEVLQHIFRNFTETSGAAATLHYNYSFDTDLSKKKSMELSKKLESYEMAAQNPVNDLQYTVENRYEVKELLNEMYGGFLFIGIFVAVLFLAATALIIYYKQISEGFEDQKRFEIMQNVGMSHAEVKKTIGTQVLMVFFLPIVVSAIHVLVSFRILKMILKMLSFGGTGMFLVYTIITFLIFCVIYGAVFMITAKNYYSIVRVER